MKEIEKLIDITCELQRIIGIRMRHTMESRGGTLLQSYVLFFLHDKPGATASKLAQTMGVSLSAITQLVDRLIGQDLLRREEDPADRRTTHLYLTEHGQHDYEQFLTVKREGMRRIFLHLSKEDIRELLRLHTILLNTFTTLHND